MYGEYFAMSDNYHLPGKNASFDPDNKILSNPLGKRKDSSSYSLKTALRKLHRFLDF
jgi:hypothetical protein